MRHFLLLLIILLISSCSLLKTNEVNDISLDAETQEDMIDINNICGNRIDIDCDICNSFCQNDVSNGCFQNRCSCGIGEECNGVSECRFERCIEADLEGVACEFDPECGPGFLCIRNHCSPAGCIPEICNGYDDDCDGQIDGTINGPLSRWCISNTMAANAVSFTPPCRAGSQICANGLWQECIGAISPVPEYGFLACDTIDNDCDGCVDGTIVDGTCQQNENIRFDVVFAIDTSGSMRAVIDAVRLSSSLFASNVSSLSSIRFGLVAFPGPRDRDWLVMQPLVAFTYFNSTLSGIAVTTNGNEPSQDVLKGLLNDTIDVDWAEDSTRIIILFTDEEPQSYAIPIATETSICSERRRGEIIAVVTNPTFFESYDLCAMTISLTSDATEMTNNLNEIIRNPCN